MNIKKGKEIKEPENIKKIKRHCRTRRCVCYVMETLMYTHPYTHTHTHTQFVKKNSHIRKFVLKVYKSHSLI